jgi:glycosyltransferase involved in cell wall biosynthesis
MNTRFALFVVHDYPPILSAGTERILKFAQYLPEFGYRPVILTTGRYGGLPTDGAAGVYRAGDLVHTLFSPWRRRRTQGVGQADQYRVATVSGQSLLGRLRDLLMIPDTKLGWLLPAVRLGRRLIAQYRPALIFSSSPPETGHLIAGQLSRGSGLPWVADLRDGWLFEPPNPALRRPPLRRALEARLERQTVAGVRAVVAATWPIAADLRLRYPTATAAITTITNGYDRAEFAGLARRRAPDGFFRLVYTGSLSFSRQGTSADAFFAGVAGLLRDDPATPQSDSLRLRVQVVGATSPAEQAAAQAHGLADIVTFLPAVSRREAHQHQLDADALLLITAAGQRSVATLKLFDYIGAGVPILALAQDNAAAAIVEQYQLGLTVAPDDPAAITRALADLMRRQRASAVWPGFAAAQEQFERRRLTGQLATLFDTMSG